MHLYVWENLDGVVNEYRSCGELVIHTDRDPNVVWLEHVEREVQRFAANDPFWNRGLDGFRTSLPPADTVIGSNEDVGEFVHVYTD